MIDAAFAVFSVWLWVQFRVADTQISIVLILLSAPQRIGSILSSVVNEKFEWAKHLSEFNLEHLKGAFHDINLDQVVSIEPGGENHGITQQSLREVEAETSALQQPWQKI